MKLIKAAEILPVSNISKADKTKIPKIAIATK